MALPAEVTAIELPHYDETVAFNNLKNDVVTYATNMMYFPSVDLQSRRAQSSYLLEQLGHDTSGFHEKLHPYPLRAIRYEPGKTGHTKFDHVSGLTALIADAPAELSTEQRASLIDAVVYVASSDVPGEDLYTRAVAQKAMTKYRAQSLAMEQVLGMENYAAAFRSHESANQYAEIYQALEERYRPYRQKMKTVTAVVAAGAVAAVGAFIVTRNKK